MKKHIKCFKFNSLILMFILMFTILFVPKINTFADAGINYEALYSEGVKLQYINPENISLDEWLLENEEYKKIYDDGISVGVLDKSFSYEEWIKANCYGQPPVVDSNNFEEITIDAKTIVDGFEFKSGDILITNGTSSAGIIGHAAIATGPGYILDIPGANQTTRQTSPLWWTNNYRTKGWVKVYRMKNSYLAAGAAIWADRNYYSTTGGSVQNITPKYEITPHLYSTDPTYCSKIVFQAYWYGTGSEPVMKSMSGFVAPYGLLDCFNSNYVPDLAKTFIQR